MSTAKWTWLGAVIGAVGWFVFLAARPALEDDASVGNLVLGIWQTGTMSGDAPWLGYLVMAAGGAVIGFTVSKTRTSP